MVFHMRVMICDDEKAALVYLKAHLQNRDDVEIIGIFENQNT